MALGTQGMQEVHSSAPEGAASSGTGGETGTGGAGVLGTDAVGMNEFLDKVYGVIADVLWENCASDTLVARLTDRLQAVDQHFTASLFSYRAYRS